MKRVSQKAHWFVYFVIMMVLFGCGKKEKVAEEKSKKPVEKVVAPKVIPAKKIVKAHPNCESGENLSPREQWWCQGEKSWKKSGTSLSSKDRYIRAYEQGILDAQSAKSPKSYKVSATSADRKGYNSGYSHVVKALGITEFSCKEKKKFYQHWCEAKSAYLKSKTADANNVILQSRFIAGYFAGQLVAQSLPPSMDTKAKEGNDHSALLKVIELPASNALPAEKIYFEGFKKGFTSMLEKVKESVNQVIKQLQLPAALK